MRIADVVKQIQSVLPRYTDAFSTLVPVTSISSDGTTATFVTPVPHGLLDDDVITSAGVGYENVIDTIVIDGTNATVTTLVPHDLTLGWPEQEFVQLGGFAEAEWVNSFKLKDVPNRNTFVIETVNITPPVSSGYLFEERIDTVRGPYGVTVVHPNTFTESGEFLAGNYVATNSVVSTNPRVASTVTIERAIDQYTEQQVNEIWGFVEPVNVTVSKDRNNFDDAVATRTNGNEYRLRALDGFTFYVIIPTSDEIAAEDAIDLARHDLLLPITRTLLGVNFGTGLTCDESFRNTITGHSVFNYSEALMVYQYNFQISLDITEADIALPSDTRAFRDIDYTQNAGAKQLTINTINLDDDS